MNKQDKLVAAIIGWVGCAAIILGSFLPEFSYYLPLQDNMLVAPVDGMGILYPLAGLLLAWRIYRAFTNRQTPFWIIFLAVWTAGWLVAEATTMKYGTGSDTFTPPPGVGLYVVGLGVMVAFGSGIALWRINRSESDTLANDEQVSERGADETDQARREDRARRQAHALKRQGAS